MTLSAIHLFNWFYSFSLNRLSLICFCNLKKKKKLVWKIRVNPTRLATRLTHFDPRLVWPTDPIDPTDPTWPVPPILPRFDWWIIGCKEFLFLYLKIIIFFYCFYLILYFIHHILTSLYIKRTNKRCPLFHIFNFIPKN